MNSQGSRLTLLARFPDLNKDASPSRGGESDGASSSAGRWIGQSASFKLLAGVMLFLMVGAVLPFAIGRGRATSGESPSTGLHRTDEASPLAELAERSSHRAAPAIQSATRRPVVLVPVAAEPTPAPAVVPSRFEALDESKAERPADPPPMMSSWPNPAPSAAEPAGVPTAIRPAEHRGGSIR